jgi:hypothetical protein
MRVAVDMDGAEEATNWSGQGIRLRNSSAGSWLETRSVETGLTASKTLQIQGLVSRAFQLHE